MPWNSKILRLALNVTTSHHLKSTLTYMLAEITTHAPHYLVQISPHWKKRLLYFLIDLGSNALVSRILVMYFRTFTRGQGLVPYKVILKKNKKIKCLTRQCYWVLLTNNNFSRSSRAETKQSIKIQELVKGFCTLQIFWNMCAKTKWTAPCDWSVLSHHKTVTVESPINA